MFVMPTSSPMMTRMLGFLAWALAPAVKAMVATTHAASAIELDNRFYIS